MNIILVVSLNRLGRHHFLSKLKYFNLSIFLIEDGLNALTEADPGV